MIVLQWKEGIAYDLEVLPLLLSMCKMDDSVIQVTAAQILAEVAVHFYTTNHGRSC